MFWIAGIMLGLRLWFPVLTLVVRAKIKDTLLVSLLCRLSVDCPLNVYLCFYLYVVCLAMFVASDPIAGFARMEKLSADLRLITTISIETTNDGGCLLIVTPFFKAGFEDESLTASDHRRGGRRDEEDRREEIWQITFSNIESIMNDGLCVLPSSRRLLSVRVCTLENVCCLSSCRRSVL